MRALIEFDVTIDNGRSTPDDTVQSSGLEQTGESENEQTDDSLSQLSETTGSSGLPDRIHRVVEDGIQGKHFGLTQVVARLIGSVINRRCRRCR